MNTLNNFVTIILPYLIQLILPFILAGIAVYFIVAFNRNKKISEALKFEIDADKKQLDIKNAQFEQVQRELSNTRDNLKRLESAKLGDINEEFKQKFANTSEFVRKNHTFLQNEFISVVRANIPQQLDFSSEPVNFPEETRVKLTDIIRALDELNKISKDYGIIFDKIYYIQRVYFALNQRKYENLNYVLSYATHEFSDDEFFRQAFALFFEFENQNKEAIKEFEILFERNPWEVGITKKLIKLYSEENKFKEAFELCLGLSERNSDDLDIAANLAFIIYQKGMVSQAQREIEKLLKKNFKIPSLHYYCGVMFDDIGNKTKAKEEYKFAYDLGCTDKWLIEKLCKLYLAETDYLEVIKLLKNYEDDITFDPEIIFNLGVAYHRLRDKDMLDEFVNRLKKLSEEKTYDYKAYLALGNLYYELEFYNDAFNSYDFARQMSPENARVIVGLAKTYNKLDNQQAARENFDKAIQVSPNDVTVLLRAGEYYTEKNEYDTANQCFTRMVQIAPSNGEAFFKMGSVLLKKDDYVRALHAFNEAIDNKYVNDEIYNCLGFIYSKQENYNEAINSYSKAIEMNPRNSDAYNNLGVLFAKKSDYKSAIHNFKIAMQIDPHCADAYYNISLAYEKLSNDKAALHFAKYVELVSD